jgi:chromosome segregation ATPase
MPSDPVPQHVELPTPASLQQLVDALTAASNDVRDARRALAEDFARHVERMTALASDARTAADAAADSYKNEIERSVTTALSKLAAQEERGTTLTAKVATELRSLELARTRLDAGLDSVATVTRQLRAERETWEAQARATQARHEAAEQELRVALATERSRISKLEAENRRLAEQQGALEERIAALEKKKLFGLF